LKKRKRRKIRKKAKSQIRKIRKRRIRSVKDLRVLKGQLKERETCPTLLFLQKVTDLIIKLSLGFWGFGDDESSERSLNLAFEK